MSRSQCFRRLMHRPGCLLPAAYVLLAAAGCGLSTYTERLDRTRRLQERLDDLDRELVTPAWANDGFRLRVPRQFSTPPDEKTATQLFHDKDVPGGVRRFIEELDAVQAVWRTKVTVRGRPAHWPAYLVLVSNRKLAAGGRHTLKDAMQFEERMIDAMFHACGQARPLRSDWDVRRLPDGREFAIAREYSVFNISAGSADAGGEPYRLLAYCVNNGSHQYALLCVLPENVAADEKLTEAERIGLSLGTLAELPN